jgi:hypothetical protein
VLRTIDNVMYECVYVDVETRKCTSEKNQKHKIDSSCFLPSSLLSLPSSLWWNPSLLSILHTPPSARNLPASYCQTPLPTHTNHDPQLPSDTRLQLNHLPFAAFAPASLFNAVDCVFTLPRVIRIACSPLPVQVEFVTCSCHMYGLLESEHRSRCLLVSLLNNCTRSTKRGMRWRNDG